MAIGKNHIISLEGPYVSIIFLKIPADGTDHRRWK